MYTRWLYQDEILCNILLQAYGIVVNSSGTMGNRKFRLTKRKNSERKRLKSRMLKTIKGRPSKQQKKYRKRSVPNEVGKTKIFVA